MSFKLHKNLGIVDRIVRIVFAIAVAVFYFLGSIEGWVALGLGVLSLIFVVTGFVSVCPLYAMLGIRTCRTEVK